MDDFDVRTAYQEGREAAAQFLELGRQFVDGDVDRRFAGLVQKLRSSDRDPIDPERAYVMRSGLNLQVRLLRLPPDMPLDESFGDVTRAVDRLHQHQHLQEERGEGIKDHADDPVEDGLLANLEAVGDQIEAQARDLGVPPDDLLSDAPQPEDEHWVRGFLDYLREQPVTPGE